MAVLPAAKAYPRGGAPRRSYVKGAPLFARFAMKFCGVNYPRGAELPVDKMSPHKHWELWTCGKADHVKEGPFDRRPLARKAEAEAKQAHQALRDAAKVDESPVAAADVSTDSSDDDEEDHVDEKTGTKTRRKKSPTATKAKR